MFGEFGSTNKEVHARRMCYLSKHGIPDTMSLADYLAKNYLNADSSTEKKTKKRKRKGTTEPSAGLTIADDDALGWNNAAATRDDEDAPITSP